jgi:hypothetical protein
MGQWPDEVLFRTTSGGATIWITKDGIVYQFTRRVPREDTSSLARWNAGFVEPLFEHDPIMRGKFGHEPDSIEQLVVKAKFVGANPRPEAVGLDEMPYNCNYFLGNDPIQWRTDVPNYTAVIVKDIYPGIDVKYSGDDRGQAAYEFVAPSGADVHQVEVRYEGGGETAMDPEGTPVFETEWNHVIEAINPLRADGAGRISPRLVVRPEGAGIPYAEASAVQSSSSTLGLVYSTYLGGSNNDRGVDIAVDASGAAYVTGETYSGNFPTSDAFQPTFGGTSDAFVTKLAAEGNSLVYSTYLGGSDDDWAVSIAVDASGAAYITGTASSANFPTANAFQALLAGAYDAFITRFSVGGNNLVYSTYLGAGGADLSGAIAIDASGAAHVTGHTFSTDFPTVNAHQTTSGGDQDVFAIKLSGAGDNLVYSTYLGGNSWDWGLGVAVDTSGAAYITGYTASTNFPTVNACQSTGGGYYNSDAFVTKLCGEGDSLVYSTYLGGSDSHDGGEGIAVDASGAAYVTGYTFSGSFPTLNAYQSTLSGGEDAFVTKLSAAGDSLVYSTYLGGSYGDDHGYGVVIEATGSAYVTGYTRSSNFPIANSYQATFAGYFDVFITKLSSAGGSLAYSTFLGGSADDYGLEIEVDASGAAYVTGVTGSANFPTANAIQPTYGVGGDAFVTKLREWTRGDVNADGVITSADVIYLVDHVFKSGQPPLPSMEAGDVNCSGSITSADIIFLVNYAFKGGPAPC